MEQSTLDSLGSTLDEFNAARFAGTKVEAADARRIALTIAERQGKAGSYRGMFAPLPGDAAGIRTFTGEKTSSRAGVAHILSEECMRALSLLQVPDEAVREATQKARAAALSFLDLSGEYCCGPCSVSLLRAAAAGAYGDTEERVAAGIRAIRRHREGGKWGNYPFYHTLLTLSDIDTPEARAELEYAKAACERAIRAPRKSDRYGDRQRELLRRVLEK